MENKKLTIGAIITLILAVSGTYFIADGDTAYYCEDKDMVMICEKLSGGIGSRCYYEDTYKICSSGWVEIEVGQEVWSEQSIPDTTPTDIPSSAGGIKWECSPSKCVRIE